MSANGGLIRAVETTRKHENLLSTSLWPIRPFTGTHEDVLETRRVKRDTPDTYCLSHHPWDSIVGSGTILTSERRVSCYGRERDDRIRKEKGSVYTQTPSSLSSSIRDKTSI